MNLANRLKIHQIGHSNRYEVVVDCHRVSANLRDVGIGVSQVLPVLTVAFFAPPGSTVVLEEPEIHLHPLARSLLAELFAEVSRERQVQFIVETHSEYLFRRMQTLIARRIIEPGRCAMYFVEMDKEGSHLRELCWMTTEESRTGLTSFLVTLWGKLQGISKKGKVRDQEEQVDRERWAERTWNFPVSHRTLLSCFLRHL